MDYLASGDRTRGLLVFFGGGKYLLTPVIEPGTVNPYGTVFAKYTKRISGIKV